MEISDPEVENEDSTYIQNTDCTTDDSFVDATSDQNDTLVDQSSPEPLPKREKKKPDRFGYNNFCIAEDYDNDKEITLREALHVPESKFWRASMEEELDSFSENDAWEIVDRPQDSTVVQCKWVF